MAEDGTVVDEGGKADCFVDEIGGGGVKRVVGRWELGELGVYACCGEHDLGIPCFASVIENGGADLGC